MAAITLVHPHQIQIDYPTNSLAWHALDPRIIGYLAEPHPQNTITLDKHDLHTHIATLDAIYFEVNDVIMRHRIVSLITTLYAFI